MSNPSVVFPAFWDAFGGSVFLDEYKGDFRRAQLVCNENEQSNVEQHGRALLFKMVLETLKGNLLPALQIAERLATERPQTEEWNQRGALYSLFSLCSDISPPYFSFAPDPDGYQRMMYHTERDLSEEALVQRFFRDCEVWNNGSASADLVSLERSLVINLYTFRVSLGKFGSQINQQSAAYSPAQLVISQKFVSDFDELCNRSARHLDEVGLQEKALTPRLRLAQVLRATGAETASLLENLSTKAESCGDRHGTAICMMHRADFLVSVPVAHIVSLNLVLVEGTGAGLFNSRWDTQEPSVRLRQATQQRMDRAEAARELYRAALAISDDISASRLSAAIHLRLGCLGHLEAFLSDNSDLISAANELKMAHELFSAGGDETGCRLVDAHFILVAVIQRDRQHLDQRVQDIIRWYQTSGYRPFMHYLGLLISRFGYSRQQSYDTAALCYDAALKLFEASNHPLSAFQVKAQQGKLLKLANDTVSSMESLARAEATLEKLIETWGANAKLNQQPWYHHMISVLKSDLRGRAFR